MSGISLTATPSAVAEPAEARRWRRAELLVPLGFLLAAFAVTATIWVNPAGRVPTNSARFESDIYLNVWFMRYAATAVAHGHLPALITTTLNWSQGVNAMWNTSMLLPGVVLAPVTLLAGPVVSLAILLTLGFAGSASTMYLVLRRWGASIGAAAVGGGLYGFSPAIMVAGEDHYHLQFAVLPPLIIDAALRLVTGRTRRPVLTGAWLGLLVAAQVFIAEELLVDTALAGLIAVILLIASRPHEMQLKRVADVAAGTVVAAAVTLVICGHALWVQFHGPLKERGSPWRPGQSGIHVGAFVTPLGSELLHGNFATFLLTHHQQPTEVLAYLGWPLLIATAVATIVFWRDIRIRVAGVAFFLLEWLGVGSFHFSIAGVRLPLPWRLLLTAPILSQALPERLPIIADGAAAVVLAFAIDRARTSLPIKQAWRLPAVAVAVAAVLLPVLPAPVPATSVLAVPSGWQSVIAGLHLKQGAPVLVLPVDPYRAGRANAMLWQSVSDDNISLILGYCIAPEPGGHAAQCGAITTMTYPQHETLLSTYRLGYGLHYAGPPRPELAEAIKTWRPAAIVVVLGTHRALGNYLTWALGPPTVSHGDVLGWRTSQLQQMLARFTRCSELAQFNWDPCRS